MFYYHLIVYYFEQELSHTSLLPQKQINAFASIAQSVEQRTENPRVGGSIPPRGTNYFRLIGKCAGVAQLAEQLTCNQQVVGSIPITSSIKGFMVFLKNHNFIWLGSKAANCCRL